MREEDLRIPENYSPDEISDLARRAKFFYSEVLGKWVVSHHEEVGLGEEYQNTEAGTITGDYYLDKEKLERLRNYMEHFDEHCREEGYGKISIRGDPEDKGKLVLEIVERSRRLEELIKILEKANLANFS